MTGLIVPPIDEEPWPTLGPGICDLIEDGACFGPGDLRGEPAVIDDEKRALIYRAYEVFPRDHPKAGKRRFKRVCISLRKGTAKTELAAWVAFAELHPEAPVRTDGWRKQGGVWVPVGRPVRDPYIPMIAHTEEQTEELAYAALLVMCAEGPDQDLFDCTLERITRVNGDGKAVALASAPDSRDGARTTFQHADEPHRLKLPRQVQAWQTMLQNIPKRPIADPWSLSTTTAGVPGEGSVAEQEREYARRIAEGKARDRQLFYFHREASPSHDLTTDEGLRAAIVEASGPAVAKWSDIDSIASLFHQADTDKAYFERVWLNRWVASSRQAFDPVRWTKDLVRPDVRIADGEPITIGFDGARWRDACGFVATHIETGFQWPLAVWEKPVSDKATAVADVDEWEVTDEQVDGALAEAVDRFQVVLVYADPPRFEANVARWSGLYGDRRVAEWYTNRPRQIGVAMRAFKTAQTSGEVTNSGDAVYARHIGNSRKGDLKILDDDDTPLWTIYKERPDSPLYIDLAMAGCLSWRARLDALAKGGWQRKKRRTIIVRR
ncbi:terminase large subunit [Micromonospora sp. NBRC 101691]|uniref:terminase large subunit n=1 Tax=Micromonospora sp. NBRC 101691 TaxID=3032198 RepID=UPI0024A3CF14|nr:terminase large subunit [Micromonospora sp. NBRC 101691]GLY21684.1 bacteriophage protein [Micromonospora sp. NBRC 101691]